MTELTDELNELFRRAYSEIWVVGEISGLKSSAAGHVYFTLKDDRAQLQCACFKMSLLRMRVKPQEGLAVVARGRLELYAQRGQHQLIVDHLEPQGFGALQLAFEQLKAKLAAEGLFESGRKRALPLYPRRIGIVTSPTGAVIQDMLHILGRRAPGLHIRLYPAQVQGEGAALQIRRGIDHFSRGGWAELVIAGRGGGSLEDLWAFNEEVVARAIAECAVPVVSAVGHETDFTIADFVADLRAPTPSAAAEIVTAHWVALPARLTAEVRHLSQAMALRLAQSRDRLNRRGSDRARAVVTRYLNRCAQQLDDAAFRLRDAIRFRLGDCGRRLTQNAALLQRQDPQRQLLRAKVQYQTLVAQIEELIRKRVAAPMLRIDRAGGRLDGAARGILHRHQLRLESLHAALISLSPLSVLDRGYAIVQGSSGQIFKEPPPGGTVLNIRYAGGRGVAVAGADPAAGPTLADSSELPS